MCCLNKSLISVTFFNSIKPEIRQYGFVSFVFVCYFNSRVRVIDLSVYRFEKNIFI